MLKKIKVKEIMTNDVITVSPNEDVIFAFEKLMKYKVSALPVTKNDKLLGIVTASDLGHNLILDHYELGTTVSNVMVEDVACVNPDDNLLQALDEVYEYGGEGEIINQVVVIEDGEIKGILSDGDIIKALKDQL